MKTKTIKIYKFKELKTEVKLKVLDNFRNKEEHIFLNENLTEVLKEKLIKNKWTFEGLEIGYSLGYCQGDGFNFKGIIKTNNAVFKITSSCCRYEHERSTNIELIEVKIKKKWCLIENLEANKETITCLKILNDFKNKYYSLCEEMEKIGYEEIEFDLSEENIISNIEANDYTFRENGQIERMD
jgi:hypothetical protein